LATTRSRWTRPPVVYSQYWSPITSIQPRKSLACLPAETALRAARPATPPQPIQPNWPLDTRYRCSGDRFCAFRICGFRHQCRAQGAS
jgi:hypothetical protein